MRLTELSETELVDDDGNLLGVINVVDALAVLLVIAVAVAGVSLILSNDSSQTDVETTYATVDLGTQPANIAAVINEGDSYSPGGSSQATITDVHLTPQGNNIRVILQVKLEGPAGEGQPTYSNAPPRLGRSITLATDLYEVNGQIRQVSDSNSITTQNTLVVIKDTISAADAEHIATGDEIRLADRTVATVENSTVYATADPNQRRVFVEATVDAHQQQGDLRFGGNQLRRGQSLSISTNEYELNGEIEQVGSGVQLGTTDTRRVTLRMDEVRADMANSLRPGLREEVGETTVAHVVGVETDPSLIIATGEGTVSVVDHPYNRDVTLTTELRVRESSTGPQFKGKPLRQGSTVVLDLGTVTAEATVVSIGS